jgi:ABC-type amino acid transport substrate-binding protein
MALAAAAALLFPGQAPAQELDLSRTYRMAVEDDYHPFSFIDPDGKRTGFDVEIGRSLCEAAGIRCQITPLPFDDIIPAVVGGTQDIGAAGFAMTEERLAIVDFTERYFRSSTIMILYGDSTASSGPVNVRGKRVGVQSASQQETYAKEHFSAAAEIFSYVSFEDTVAALRAGECDMALVDGLAGFTFIRSEAGEGFDITGDPYPLETEARMVVPKSLPALNAALSAAIRQIRQSGVYDEINRRYFSFSVY